MKKPTIFYVKAGLIAALYVVLTLPFASFSYGPIQFRVAEALTIIPLYETAAIPGLFIGCMFANIFGGFGLVDIVFGSLTTLLAAYLTSKAPNMYIGVLPPILLNALIIPIWVSKMSYTPYLATVGTIGFGQFLSAGILGVILATAIEILTKTHTLTIIFIFRKIDMIII
ncbi:QueT transporter family protein [Caloramator sp. mosi_1]|uniref:QueT transporter family protein n=1 Tax=Caloramator sp. mosi_1 TaxID=3023090 RepID=UPI00236119D2|nr:QueT transporter family protein [Caloramator sp. mosi_1]WDC83767.1 QueT transporter family protein [Caloramator sp. mosi_1]